MVTLTLSQPGLRNEETKIVTITPTGAREIFPIFYTLSLQDWRLKLIAICLTWIQSWWRLTEHYNMARDLPLILESCDKECTGITPPIKDLTLLGPVRWYCERKSQDGGDGIIYPLPRYHSNQGNLCELADCSQHSWAAANRGNRVLPEALQFSAFIKQLATCGRK